MIYISLSADDISLKDVLEKVYYFNERSTVYSMKGPFPDCRPAEREHDVLFTWTSQIL
jgi:hypothetical protein